MPFSSFRALNYVHIFPGKMKNKTEFSFVGKFDDSKTEGLMKISMRIFNYLKKSYHISLNTYDADIINIHSGGINYLVNRKINKKKTVYSLYTNIFFNRLKRIRYLIPHLFLYSKDRKLKLLRIISYGVMNLFFPVWLKRYLLSKVKLVVVPTNYLKRKLKLRNCLVVPFGVDINKFRPFTAATSKEKIRCAYIGAFSLSKGFSDVILAYKLLHKERNKEIEKSLYFSNDSYLLNKAKLKKKYNISVYGRQNDITKLYNKVDIIILPYKISSGSIGIPLTMLEAMSSGKAVITTDFSHLKEVGRDAVVYVNPSSPEQIANAIKKLAENKKLREDLGRKARKIVKDNYTEEKMLRAYDELYKKLAENLK